MLLLVSLAARTWLAMFLAERSLRNHCKASRIILNHFDEHTLTNRKIFLSILFLTSSGILDAQSF
jgi:hypothetical protein